MNQVWQYISIVLYTVNNPANLWYINPINHNILLSRSRRFHNLRQRRGQRHLVTEVHMTAFQEFLNLRTCSTHTWKNGENRFLTLLNLFMQDVVDLKYLNQSWCTEDDHNSIDILHALTVINSNTQMFCRSCSKNINGVSHTTAWQ